MNRTVVQTGFGDVEDVIRVERSEVPKPGPDEILVELVLAPINPAELLIINGSYGYGASRAQLPRKTGVEGVGRVVGGDTERVPKGTLVCLAGTPGVLADYRIIPAATALTLEPGANVEQVAIGFLNTQCVLLNLNHPAVVEGGWVIQNAANSGYGRIVDAIASSMGISLINVVRSERAAAEIAESARGPVIIDGPDLAERVLALTDGAPPTFALDAVAGQSTGRLAAALAPGGTVLTYGLLSGQPCQVDTHLVVFHGIHLEGFWFPRARAALDSEALRQLQEKALNITSFGAGKVPVAGRYPIDDIVRAFSHAANEARSGKIVVHR